MVTISRKNGTLKIAE